MPMLIVTQDKINCVYERGVYDFQIIQDNNTKQYEIYMYEVLHHKKIIKIGEFMMKEKCQMEIWLIKHCGKDEYIIPRNHRIERSQHE